MNKDHRPKVGLGVIILKGDKVLFGKRIGSHEASVWCIPGGHLEFGEQFVDCAAREVMEETGLRISNIRFGNVTNNINQDAGWHYVTITMVADYVSGQPEIKEPAKCAAWRWFSLQKLPKKLCQFNAAVFAQGFDPRRI